MRSSVRMSMVATLVIGILAVCLAVWFTTVLDAILYAYGFLVSGLFIPTLGAYFWKRGSSTGALAGMLTGGVVNLVLVSKLLPLPGFLTRLEFDNSVYGIVLSGIVFVACSLLFPDTKQIAEVPAQVNEENSV